MIIILFGISHDKRVLFCETSPQSCQVSPSPFLRILRALKNSTMPYAISNYILGIEFHHADS